MDQNCLGRLVDRHAAALELYARQWCDSPEDVVQEAFLKLASQRLRPEKPVAWLFRVVRNGAINAALAASRRRRHETESVPGSAIWFEADPSKSRPGALEPEVATAELESLPLEQREVIVAHLWGGLTFEQIGEVSGRSASSAHRLYCAGLASIRERLRVSCP